jgi:hypothetical protein
MNRLPLAASLCCGLLSLIGCSLLSQCGDGSGTYGKAAYDHTAAIVAFGPRPPESEALASTLDYVSAKLAEHGWVTQQRSFESFTPKGKVTFTNLVARYAPAGDQPEVWTKPVKGLLCAHIESKLYSDRVFVGADDAASAVGAIIEIASVLNNTPDRARQLELVFFDGEEAFEENITSRDGLYGSRRYAANWRRQDTKPDFGIVLDMIGHKNLSIALPSDTPKHLADLVFESAEQESARSHFDMAANPIIDDHVPLNDAGIPTVDIIGDFTSGNWWHTPRDNLDLISTESLDISIRVVLTMLEELLPSSG